MIFMNAYEIADRAEFYADHPVLGPATSTLANLAAAADANSDGWCHWRKPMVAAKRLMELIEREGTNRYYHDPAREDATVGELRKAYTPIKSFRTRTGIQFEIVEP